MAKKCSAKLYSSDQKFQIKSLVTNASAIKTANNNRVMKSVSDILSDIESRLIDLDSSQFKTTFDESLGGVPQQIEALNQLKEDLIQTINSRIDTLKDKYDIIPDSEVDSFKNQLIEGITDYFNNNIGLSEKALNSTSDNTESVPNIEGAQLEDETSRRETNLQAIKNRFYLSAISVESIRDSRFKLSILKKFIIDQDTQSITGNNEDLNRNIAEYKNELYNNIVDYLHSVNIGMDINGPLFNIHNGSVSIQRTRAYNLFWNHIKELQGIGTENYADKLQQYVNMLNHAWSVENSGKKSELLRALNSYINLVYFDDLITDAFGNKVISINKNYKDTEVAYNLNKYTFGVDGDSHRKSWGTDEGRSAIDEIAKFSKLVISIIPMYNSKHPNLKPFRQLDIVSFSNAITNLFQNINDRYSQLSKPEQKILEHLKHEITTFHRNPYLHGRRIFASLFNPSYVSAEEKQSRIDQIRDILTGPTIKLNDFDFNVLYSIYVTALNEQDKSSFINIETTNRKNKLIPEHYSIIECLFGTMDRVLPANYWENIYDSNGNLTSGIKSKYPNRKEEYNIRNAINQYVSKEHNTDQRIALQKIYTITPVQGLANNIAYRSINFAGKYQVYISNAGSKGLFNSTLNKIEISLNPPKNSRGLNTNPDEIIFQKVFSRNSPIDLSDKTIVQDILKYNTNSNADVPKEIQYFTDMLKFIKAELNIDFLSNGGLQTLAIYKQLYTGKYDNFLSDIIMSAARSAYINNLYIDFNQQVQLENYSPSQFMGYFQSTHKGFSREDLNNIIKIKYNQPELLVVPDNISWIDNLATSKAILSGEISKAITKDIQGNGIANYRTSFLGGNIHYYINKVKQEAQVTNNTTAAADLFFVDNADLLEGIVINTDAQAKNTLKKKVKDMKTGELFHQAMITNFFNQFLTNGNVLIQPTTYSDKTTFLNYLVNASTKLTIPNFEGNPNEEYVQKGLMEMNEQELLYIYSKTIGGYYNKIYNKVIDDYRKIYGPIIHTALDVEVIIKTKSEQQLLADADAHGVQLQLDTHYRTGSYINESGESVNYCRFNELLYHYATDLYNIYNQDSLKARLLTEQFNFVNDLLASGIKLNTTYFDESDSLKDSKNPLAKAITSNKFLTKSEKLNYEQTWIKNGRLILAKIDGKDIYNGGRISGGVPANFELNPLLKKYFLIDSLTSNNLRLLLTGSEIGHPDKSGVVNKKTSNIAVIDLDQKDQFGNNISYSLNKLGILPPTKVGPTTLVELDSYINNLLNAGEEPTQEIFDALHMINLAYNKIEANAQGTQLKRNVIIPATLQYMQPNINGVPTKFKVATIKDTKAKIFNFRGDSETEDAHDGSAFILSWVSMLQNNSLQDQEVSNDNQKPIWHHYDSNTGTATLLKFATFVMSNERIRASLNSDISLYNLFKKMTNLQWNPVNGVQINLLHKAYGRGNIDFASDILNGNKLYYQDGDGQHYQITGFGQDTNGIYYTEERKVSPSGIEQGDIHKKYHLYDNEGNQHSIRDNGQEIYIDPNLHTINSLFELFNTFGGIFSEDLVEDDNGNTMLQYSESSNNVVVQFMNKVTYKKDNKPVGFNYTTEYYEQPLKTQMIAYAANASAVKNGVNNINESSAWYDKSKLMYQELDVDGLGMQMDPDHDVEEAQLTEFSQVITALESGGRLHSISRQVYKDLGKVALQSFTIEMSAISDYLSKESNMPKYMAMNKLYDIVGKTIINNFKMDSSKAELASEIIMQIANEFGVKNLDHFEDSLKIPFSDSNIYSNILSTFVSNINKKSIKRKYPGSGMVMIPGYNIMQTYKVGGRDYQFTDLLRLARLQANELSNSDNKYNEYVQGQDITEYNKYLVTEYLQRQFEESPWLDSNEKFIPTDLVTVKASRSNIDDSEQTFEVDFNLDGIQDYYSFKDQNWINFLSKKDQAIIKQMITEEKENNNPLLDPYRNEFNINNILRGLADSVNEDGESGLSQLFSLYGQEELLNNPYIQLFNSKLQYKYNFRKPKNLAPARVWWQFLDSEGDGKYHYMNIFDIKEVRDSFLSGVQNQKAIQNVFDNLKLGKFTYQGRQITLANPEIEIHNEAAELVLSNIYGQKFGTSGKSLAYIQDNISEFFNAPKVNQRIPIDAQLVLQKGNNNHDYITFKPVTYSYDDAADPKLITWKYTQRLSDNSIICTTKDNQPLYEIGRVIKSDAVYNDSLKSFTKDGQVLPNQSNYFIEDGQVYENVYYINKYRLVKQLNNKTRKYNIIQIDRQAINKIVEANKEVKNGPTEISLVGRALNNLYNAGSYYGINILGDIINPDNIAKLRGGVTQIDVNLAKLLSKTLNSITTSSEATQNLISGIANILTASNYADPETTIFTVDKKSLLKVNNKYAKNLKNEIQSSFKKSLTFTSSRIPAQTLQSFMQMKAVGFTENSHNICYVSHWQTWLQGSDYQEL